IPSSARWASTLAATCTLPTAARSKSSTRDASSSRCMLRPSLVIAAPLVVFASLAVAPLAAADEETPVIKLASPLGVAQGTTTKVTLRGLKLDNAQGVECSDGKSTAKIIGQGNAN